MADGWLSVDQKLVTAPRPLGHFGRVVSAKKKVGAVAARGVRLSCGPMLIPFSLPVVALLAVVAQALFAAALLVTAPANRLPNRLLAALLTAVALWELDAFGRVSGLYRQNPELYFLPIYYSLAFGPLLWLYVRALLNHDYQFSWRREGWHFAPVALQAVLYWTLRFTDYDTRNWFWQHIHQPFTYRLEFIGTWLSLMIYLGLSLARLRRYARWLPENFSELSALRLRWLRLVLLGVGLVSAQWLVELVLREAFNRYYAYDYSTWLLGAVLLLLGAGGLRQADMRGVSFEAGVTEAVPEAALPAPPARVADPAVVARLRQALEDERLYLNPTLTLAELATHTGLAPRTISATINAGFGRPFAEVVNRLRVAEVQRRLREPGVLVRYTLLGIALESGFNSKSTFNRVFKEQTGTAPGEWQDNGV